MKTIIFLVILVTISMIVKHFFFRSKKDRMEVKNNIMEFEKLFPKLEKGDKKTKNQTIKLLKSLKESFIEFSTEVKDKTGNPTFGRQEINSLNEVVNAYQKSDIADRKILHSLQLSVKKINDLFSQGMLVLYKKMQEKERQSHKNK